MDNAPPSAPPVDPARDERIRAAVERVTAAVDPQRLSRAARDLDCHDAAPRVTWALRRDPRYQAETVYVSGWLSRERRHLAYAHVATAVLDRTLGVAMIADLTAQQYTPDVPAVWVAHLPAYLDRLAAATGAEIVRIGLDPESSPVPLDLADARQP